MCELFIDDQLRRAFAEEDRQKRERGNVVPFPLVANRDPAIIRSQIGAGCKALGLSEESRAKAEAAGLDEYWRNARSNAWCVSVGMRKARELSGKYRVPVREPEPPQAA